MVEIDSVTFKVFDHLPLEDGHVHHLVMWIQINSESISPRARVHVAGPTNRTIKYETLGEMPSWTEKYIDAANAIMGLSVLMNPSP